jgi:hypothetical protein
MAEYVRVQEASDPRDPTRADAQHVDADELEPVVCWIPPVPREGRLPAGACGRFRPSRCEEPSRTVSGSEEKTESRGQPRLALRRSPCVSERASSEVPGCGHASCRCTHGSVSVSARSLACGCRSLASNRARLRRLGPKISWRPAWRAARDGAVSAGHLPPVQRAIGIASLAMPASRLHFASSRSPRRGRYPRRSRLRGLCPSALSTPYGPTGSNEGAASARLRTLYAANE